jgi:choice-of-anchor A domain-containing protein/pilin isopeptide linkage protein/LPXTG-motif cell wall-anchored protein
VVFLDENDVGIVTASEGGRLTVIAGDYQNSGAVSEFTADASGVTGYGVLTETETPAQESPTLQSGSETESAESAASEEPAESEPASAASDAAAGNGAQSSEAAADAQSAETEAASSGAEQAADASADADSAQSAAESAADETASAARTFNYSDADVAITAVVAPEAGLPENVEFSVTPVLDNTVQYHDAAAQSEAVVGEKPLLQKIYNICFLSDGAEVEPQAGSVQLHFDFTAQPLTAPGDSSTDVDVRVVHIEDSQTASEIPADAVVSKDGEVESLDFSAKSFSLYSISLLSTTSTTLLAGSYGSYTFGYNDTKDAFTTEAAYSQFYSAASPLGIAGSFHLVGFDTVTLEAHCNGNILANQLYANSNFGTKGLSSELSYIVNYQKVSSNSGYADNDILVLGSGNTVAAIDNDSALNVNGTKIDTPKNVVQDSDSDTAPFIDLIAVKSQISSISTALAAVTDRGTSAIAVVDTSKQEITLNDTSHAGYITLTTGFLNSFNGTGNTLQLYGLDSNTSASLIINVDCTGCNSITLPNALIMTAGGQEIGTEEETAFSYGKVIWNFTNATGVTINAERMNGTIIAPGATVILNQNLNGTVIADNIDVKAESHRTDFTGTTIPGSYSWSASLTGTKQLDGNTAGRQAFKFNLDKLDDGIWRRVGTTTQSNGSISFDAVSWETAGTYWYRISEQTTGYDAAIQNGYEFDDTVYLVKVEVADTKLSPTITYYKVTGDQTTALAEDGTVNMSFVKAAADGAVFHNKTAYALPSTGGAGTMWYTMGGLGLMAAGLVLSFYFQRKRKGGYSGSPPG